ncbi:hypothetical protein PIROE2DRAFT_9193, partial [Piromyces sp. E2]
SINAITRKIDAKNIKVIGYRVDEAISFMLLATLVYHFTILLMFISFARSQDTKFIVYKICYLTVFELIPLFASCGLLFLRWKDNIKPFYLKIIMTFTDNRVPLTICRLCSALMVVFGLFDVINVPTQEYEDIYETKKVYFEKQKEIIPDNINENLDSGRDSQRVVLTKKQEIRLELARLSSKIDKMGLRKSNKKDDSSLLDKKSKSMETMRIKKDNIKPLKKTISTYTLKDNTRKLYQNKSFDSRNKFNLDDNSSKKKFNFFNKLKNKTSTKSIKSSLKAKKSNAKFESALSEVENAVERMMLTRLDDQRVTM